MVINISKSFTHKMAVKTSWHRYGRKLRHSPYVVGQSASAVNSGLEGKPLSRKHIIIYIKAESVQELLISVVGYRYNVMYDRIKLAGTVQNRGRERKMNLQRRRENSD